MDYIHGYSYPIIEFYIPEANITFNVANGELHVFREEAKEADKRFNFDVNMEETDFPDVVVDLLKKYFEAKVALEKYVGALVK